MIFGMQPLIHHRGCTLRRIGHIKQRLPHDIASKLICKLAAVFGVSQQCLNVLKHASPFHRNGTGTDYLSATEYPASQVSPSSTVISSSEVI
jgi:hypothetical protein